MKIKVEIKKIIKVGETLKVIKSCLGKIHII